MKELGQHLAEDSGHLSMKKLLALFLLSSFAIWAQANDGELDLTVKDQAGLTAKATVEIFSEANQYQNTSITDDAGKVVAKRLPYGVYHVVSIRLALPAFHRRWRCAQGFLRNTPSSSSSLPSPRRSWSAPPTR